MVADVRPKWADRALAEAAETVAASGEPAERLFGPPEEWAAERIRTWLEEDDHAFLRPDDAVEELTPRFLTFATLFAAASFSLLFGVVELLRGRWSAPFSAGWLAAPLVLGVVVVGLTAAFQRVNRRRGFATAVALSVVMGAAAVAAGSGFFMAINGLPRWQAPVLIWLGLAAVYGLLAVGVLKVWPERPRTASSSARRAGSMPEVEMPDAAALVSGAALEELWLRYAREGLRARGRHTGRGVNEALREAEEHARQSGQSLWVEFGDPWNYARRLPGDPGLPIARRALVTSVMFLAGVALLIIQLVEGEFSWVYPLMILLATALLAAYLGRARRVRRAQRAQRGQQAQSGS